MLTSSEQVEAEMLEKFKSRFLPADEAFWRQYGFKIADPGRTFDANDVRNDVWHTYGSRLLTTKKERTVVFDANEMKRYGYGIPKWSMYHRSTRQHDFTPRTKANIELERERQAKNVLKGPR